MSTRITHRRADGQPSFLDTHPTGIVWDIIAVEPAADYIQEQWDGDTLLRFRTVRLGVGSEPCESCEGTGQDMILHSDCLVCKGRKIKPRLFLPGWTEVSS
jgi:hypothetical protein